MKGMPLSKVSVLLSKVDPANYRLLGPSNVAYCSSNTGNTAVTLVLVKSPGSCATQPVQLGL